MKGLILRQFKQQLPFIGLVAVATTALWALSQMPVTHAQTSSGGDKICRAAMIIDRSGSVGAQGVETIRNQIKRLFQPTGLYDDKVQLAFWVFSDGAVQGGGGNYNYPFHGYVSSKGETPTFITALNSIVSTGGTNYQQGFGYSGNTRNPALNDIIEATDIIVFMSDGQPNAPVGFGTSSPQELGRQAAIKHSNAGRVLVGGSVGQAIVSVMNYTVTGNANDSSKTFTISNNYGDLAAKLKQQIDAKCRELFPPEPCPYNPSLPKEDPACVPPVAAAYNLLPLVTSDNTVISSDESAAFTYKVTNESPNVTTGDVGWSIKQVVVDKGQSADPLFYGSDKYRDGYSCATLLNLIGNNGTCQDNVASGTKKFSPGGTTLSDLETGSASRLVVEDKWPVGTKVCYVLSVNKPTEKDSPKDRYSKAVCVVIGKRPTIHVYGGDLSVGKRFANDTEPIDPTAAKVQAGVTIKGDPVNRVFGSWVEYGVFAPGPVIGVASASGLEGGFPATTGELQGFWSKLTFANINGYGSFTDAWTLPDTPGALLASGGVVTQLTEDTKSFNGTVARGIYEKQSGNLTLTSGVLDKGSQVVVHVPNGTVTIDGNLSYNDGPYSSIKEIPRLVIIARAINIKSNTTQVDAWLIARNSATSTGGGVVNTCSDGPVALSITDCDKALRINGPVMARQVLLRRTAGSGSGQASGEAAEIINLRADAYLSSLANRGDVTLPMTTSTVELPPRF